MGKNLHIICGNCGSDEDFNFRVSGEIVTIVCSRCFKTTDLGDVITNLTPGAGIERQPYESAGHEEYASIWEVRLTDAGPTKLNLVKAIKDITGLGLKEAKDIADFSFGSSNGVIISGVTREKAEDIASVIIDAGASLEIIDTKTRQSYIARYARRH